MRHKPWAEDYLKSCPHVYFDGSIYQGKWLKTFPFSRCIVEIGCGKGDYIQSMADLEKDALWVGIEKDVNVSATALKKFDQKLNDNAHWIVGDAENLEAWFGKAEVDRVHLNFSDPWPKKAHTKRRLTSDKFIERLLRILKDRGEIRFKSDNKSLFEYTLLLWGNYPLELIEFSVDYRREKHDDDAITEYEQRFMSKNQPIYRAVWRKKDAK